MPPGPAYNWLCVLHTTAEILSHATRYRAVQIAPRIVQADQVGNTDTRKRGRTGGPSVDAAVLNGEVTLDLGKEARTLPVRGGVKLGEDAIPGAREAKVLHAKVDEVAEEPTRPSVLEPAEPPRYASVQTIHIDPIIPPPIPHEIRSSIPDQSLDFTTIPTPQRNLKASKVPSSRIGRLFHYGGLAASLSYGAASEIIRRTGGLSNEQSSSVMMTEANISRLVSKLSQMRGAALKLGQFLSIQDTHLLPPEVDKIFRRVQDSAHYMPDWQMEKVLSSTLTPSWPSLFTSFTRIPFAAASLGQVHHAILAPAHSPTGQPYPVAVKIQFPSIRESIESDIGYVKTLLTAGKLLPRGLFLERSVEVLKAELADECDYIREASFLRTFRSPEYLGRDPRFKVPWVWEGSTETVLVMERMEGVSVGEAGVLAEGEGQSMDEAGMRGRRGLTQHDRDDISAWIIELCLKELFVFRTMQTDPNWTNFLWNARTRQIELVDFGATRTYTKEFMDSWFALLQAAAEGDQKTCMEWSAKLGYLTGEENEVMLNAHISSLTLLATPFKSSTIQPFAFGAGTEWAKITNEIRAQIPVMLRERLTPPPRETYSLNRKLSGSFLLASRLGGVVDTKAIWDKVVGGYTFGSEHEESK